MKQVARGKDCSSPRSVLQLLPRMWDSRLPHLAEAGFTLLALHCGSGKSRSGNKGEGSYIPDIASSVFTRN